MSDGNRRLAGASARLPATTATAVPRPGSRPAGVAVWSDALRRLLARVDDADGDAVAISGVGDEPVRFAHFRPRVRVAESRLLAERTRVLATRLDNGTDAIVLDLAALRAGVIHVPLPGFFTAEQVAHVLDVARVGTLIEGREWTHRAAPTPVVPLATAKITFTSGTTGAPKGVCLDAGAVLAVAGGIAAATTPLGIRRHLCALPFAVLLENVAGIYAPLLHGATIIAPPLAEVGLQGAAGFDPARFDAALRAHDAHSVVMLPQMLRGWVAWLTATGHSAPASLRLVAVGGAPVGAATIAAARAAGVPVCEGYGLSEGASVQTLNLPGATRDGSVGRPLPHARLRTAADGEIEIGGPLMLGYLGADGRFEGRGGGDDWPGGNWWPTGDLGTIDRDGFVHLHGRKKDVLITGFGRNVSPEWVETALHDADPLIARAVVVGDARPALGAVLWPADPTADDARLAAAVDRANAKLPDYARIDRWIRADAPFDAASGQATANGRPRRPAIARLYEPRLYGRQDL